MKTVSWSAEKWLTFCGAIAGNFLMGCKKARSTGTLVVSTGNLACSSLSTSVFAGPFTYGHYPVVDRSFLHYLFFYADLNINMFVSFACPASTRFNFEFQIDFMLLKLIRHNHLSIKKKDCSLLSSNRF